MYVCPYCHALLADLRQWCAAEIMDAFIWSWSTWTPTWYNNIWITHGPIGFPSLDVSHRPPRVVFVVFRSPHPNISYLSCTGLRSVRLVPLSFNMYDSYLCKVHSIWAHTSLLVLLCFSSFAPNVHCLALCYAFVWVGARHLSGAKPRSIQV